MVVIAALGYVIGRPILGGFPKGGDTPYHLTTVRYIDRYFPHLPAWFYQHGTGYPFLGAYPPASYYLCFLVHRALGLGIFDSYSLVGLLSVVATALGVYLFAELELGDRLAALMAAVFYLLTPISWGWLTQWGYFPQTVGLAFLALTVALFALYQEKSGRLYLLATVLCCSLSLLTHLVSGLIMTNLLLFILVITGFPGGRLGFKAATGFVKVVVASLALTAYWFLPFFTLNPPSQFGTLDPWHIPALYVAEVVGADISAQRFWTTIHIFALIGAIYAFKRRRAVFWLAVVAGFFLFLATAPSIVPAFGAYLVSVYAFTNIRFVIPAMILLPVVAAFGFTEIRKTLLRTLKRHRDMRGDERFLRGEAVSLILALTILLATAYVTNPYSSNLFSDKKYWNVHSGDYRLAEDILSNVELDNLTRVDVSPRLGGLMETFNILSDAPQVNAYFYQASLIHGMWGYQQSVFYGPVGGKTELRSLARWFGVRYVILSGADPLWKYEEDGFTPVYSSSGVHVLRFKDAAGLVEVRRAPTVLVIGSEERAAFDPVFYATVSLGYDPGEFCTIRGGGRVDEYSADQLEAFDAVILYGYGYRDSSRAWGLLRDYVAEGGSLLVETGWQYVSADWSNPSIPEPSPVSATLWASRGKQWDFSYTPDHPITAGINFSRFSPAIYGEDQPWGFSASGNESVREWARPVLWNHGLPLVVAGEYGKGRVVWCGLNLLAHASSYQNAEETSLFGRMIDWIRPSQPADESGYRVSRPSPDRVVLDIYNASERSGLLFREAYFANWHAYLLREGDVSGLRIYRAGPGFMYVHLPENLTYPVKVVLQYETSPTEWVGRTVSFAALCILVVYVLSHCLKILSHRRTGNE